MLQRPSTGCRHILDHPATTAQSATSSSFIHRLSNRHDLNRLSLPPALALQQGATFTPVPERNSPPSLRHPQLPQARLNSTLCPLQQSIGVRSAVATLVMASLQAVDVAAGVPTASHIADGCVGVFEPSRVWTWVRWLAFARLAAPMGSVLFSQKCLRSRYVARFRLGQLVQGEVRLRSRS